MDSTSDEVTYSEIFVLLDPGKLSFRATKDHLQIRVEDDFVDPAKITYYDLMVLHGRVHLCEVNPAP